jgi:hypothetical protein
MTLDVDDISDRQSAQLSETRGERAPKADGAQGNRAAPTSLRVVGVLGLALPAVAYFWFIHQYAVNVPYWDQWSDVNLIDHLYSGNLNLAALWAPHFDHRMLFPNLIVLALAQSTHFNIVFEEYLSGVMLVAAVGLFLLAHKRRSPSTPWIYYCPVALLMFSFVQFQNTLWGFQVAWYLVLLALAVDLFLLDRPTMSWLVLTVAIAAAVIGSFSSLQGLLIWPAGLVLLVQRHRSNRLVLAWVVSTVTTGAVYFYHFDAWGYSNRYYVLTHPVVTLKFFFFTIGAVVGEPAGYPSAPTILLGVVIFSVAVWVLIAYGLRHDEAGGGSPIGVALICFGLLFAATITQGRAWFSFLPYQPRYTTYDLLILVGCYLALLDRLRSRVASERSPKISLSAMRVGLLGQPSNTQDQTKRGTSVAPAVVLTVLIGVICLQVALGTGKGLTSARSWSASQKEVADVTVNVDSASDTLVRNELIREDPVLPRELTRTMRSHHLSLFATNAKVYYTRVGLFAYLTDLHTNLIIPTDGAKLKRTRLLDAAASDNSGVTKVEFHLLDRDKIHGTLVVAATPSAYGWFAYWNTTSVANGTYMLQSIAYGPDDKTSYSPGITITVIN